MQPSSESIKSLAAAFCKAQPKIEGAVKDKTNPAFRSKYADLGSVVDAIKPALASEGLSFLQVPHDADSAARIETLLMHASGEWISLGTVTVPVTKLDAQGFGSALTYARRYGLLTAFGVAPEDDDGNAAAAAAPKAMTGDELASVHIRLEEAAKKGTGALQTAWAAIPNDAKVALRDVKEKLKHTAADVDAARQAA
jgi:hypothetical protein